VRIVSEKKEDIFNVDFKTLRKYDLLHRVLSLDLEQTQKTKASTKLDLMHMTILESLEHLFNSDYKHNEFKGCQPYENGYFKLNDILRISKLKPYNIHIKQILKIEPFALNWELGSKNEFIRSKNSIVNKELQVLGFSQ